MHPLLISQIAQDEIAQRIRSTERERLARQASRPATPAGLPRPGARSDSQRLVHRWLAQRPAWRKASPRMDTTAAETCPDGDGS
jgi:hypothetical protein